MKNIDENTIGFLAMSNRIYHINLIKPSPHLTELGSRGWFGYRIFVFIQRLP